MVAMRSSILSDLHWKISTSAGGWRDSYRSLGETGEAIEGFGKNGQPFKFRRGPVVDASGNLADGQKFADIFELKKLLVANRRSIANKFASSTSDLRDRRADEIQ